ncbi:MAG TPA: RNase adapter RapZ [Bacilli bacterium]|nr:RNase adapter RapZ [Bacilli bacterium]HPS18676.1 RNase adapter RapZ [Bacilli bacterium]
MFQLDILTGPSGSGITSAKFVFEELGYYIVVNSPYEATESILNSFLSGSYKTNKFCLVVSIFDAKKILEFAKKNPQFHTRLVLLYADRIEIQKRYRLSRHVHPRCFTQKISLDQAIDLDYKESNDLFQDADIYIDTTALSIKALRINLYNKLSDRIGENITAISFISFGYKNGTPMDLDMVFDVRDIPNPYWVDDLKPLNGLDKPVIDYMNSFPETHQIIDNIVKFLEFHLECVQKTGRPIYNIGIACSGGQHRSTYVAHYLAEHFKNKYKTRVFHRDSPELNEDNA